MNKNLGWEYNKKRRFFVNIIGKKFVFEAINKTKLASRKIHLDNHTKLLYAQNYPKQIYNKYNFPPQFSIPLTHEYNIWYLV